MGMSLRNTPHVCRNREPNDLKRISLLSVSQLSVFPPPPSSLFLSIWNQNALTSYLSQTMENVAIFHPQTNILVYLQKQYCSDI